MKKAHFLLLTAVLVLSLALVGCGKQEASAPSETAYYLVWDTFTMVSTGGSSPTGFSSWDVATPTSSVGTANGGAMYTDDSIYSDAHMQRVFNETSEDLTWEFTAKVDETLEGTFIDMRYQDTVAIRFVTKGGKLYVQTATGETELCDIASEYVNITVNTNMADGTYTLSVGGKTVPGALSFLNKVEKLDRMYIQTTKEAKGNVYLGTVRVYVGYYINEKFLDANTGVLPDTWTVTGNVTAAYKTGTQDKDQYSALLTGDASFGRDVSYKQDGAWVEYQVLVPDNAGEVVMVLSDGKTGFKVATKDGAFGYYNTDGSFQKLYDCVKNVWYHVMLKQTGDGTHLYLNHKDKGVVSLPFKKFTNITFQSTGVKEAYVDDIVVKDWIPYPEDYVAAPVSGSDAGTDSDDGILVGLQSCNLWTEGHHFGWDWMTDWEERKTVLGFYDEYLPETADWEIKFKVEHGIDFELFCWYRPQNGSNDEPIKYNRNAEALHEGYFNARYSDQLKFAITWETAGGPVSGLKDFQENVVPYWIEQYFKDERYLLIDNKPVVGMYNISKMVERLGSLQHVKKALEFLRQACVDAGFDGCYIIMSNSNANDVAKIAEAGFDGQYAYAWGHSGYLPGTQKSGMQNVQDAAVAADAADRGIIPVVSMGFDDVPWVREEGGFISLENWELMLNWVKDEFMPTLDEDSLGSKMLLLDNWNEYGEGHFLMPANLHGFGYLDGVREIFGDGDTTHTDVEPTEAQLERINHLFVQDRHVVKVDKNTGVQLEVYDPAYVWTFDNDAQGWTVAPEDHDRYRHELEEFEWNADGSIYGKTWDDPADLGLTESGDPRIIDPSIASPDMELSAASAKYVRVRMKYSGVNDVANPCIYFNTSEDAAYAQTRSVSVAYNAEEADEEGYVELLFNMSGNAAWTGTITNFRFDVIDCAGEFTVDSIEILKTVGQGDALVYYEGTKIGTVEPVRYVNDTVMYAAKDLKSTVFPISVITAERLDGSAVELYVNEKVFISLPFDSNTIVVNGVEKQIAQGATKIDGLAYVPIKDVMESSGLYLTEWNEADMKLNILIDPSTQPYQVVKSFLFTNGNDDWVNGGAVNPWSYTGGVLSGTGNDGNARVWSSTTSMALSAADVSHVRIRVKSSVEGESTLQLDVVRGDGGPGMYYTATYGTEPDKYGYSEVLLDLRSDENWATLETIARIGVHPNVGVTGATYWIDSVEFLWDSRIERTEPDVGERPEHDGVRVLILGNSITQHGVREDYGWLGDWGMAATSEENDYVHLLMAQIQAKYGNVEVKYANISEYEKYFYNLAQVSDPMKELAQWDADIIISTIGANIKSVPDPDNIYFVNTKLFTKEYYKAILDRFNIYGAAEIIVGITPLTGTETAAVIKEAIAEYGWASVDMTSYTGAEYLADEEALKAVFGVDKIYSGVLTHPGDKGMQAIADDLWPLLDAAVQKLAK